MKPYLVKMPKFVQWLFPKRIWAFSSNTDTVYLTFDDGPIPEVTPWVLSELKKHNAHATFFCIGDNINKYPSIFQQIIAEGHSVGNHTYHHINGSKTEASAYVQNVLKAEETIQSNLPNSQKSNMLFRPPYGKLTSKQAKLLQQQGYKIIMWDVLSADFDTRISEEKCLQNVIKNIRPGSILIFHDSLKAEKNLRYALPKVLEFLAEKKWNCKPIL